MAKKKNIPIHVPDWARGVVWYQIMPERFRNGDPNNTPRAIDQKNAWPHDHTSPLELHPWGSDWYRLESWERDNGRDIWFHLQRRRYGGDLLGIIDKLDYLEDLGIGALYLNPVFEAPSAHKYDAASYHHVDPNFGPDPAGDRAMIAREIPHEPSTWSWTEADLLLLELIEQVHRRDMYIILDGVFNHMGLNSWIYQDILKYQGESPFRDWMAVESWADPVRSRRRDKRADRDKKGAGAVAGGTGKAGSDHGKKRNEKDVHPSDSVPEMNVPDLPEPSDGYNPATPFRKGFRVRTWEGFAELPELRQDRRGIVDGPRQYIFEITRRWMNPHGNGDTFAGVDGWRLDVAHCIKHPFWKAWRKHVRSINPEAYLVAEAIDSVEKTGAWLKGDEFDAVMNYNFQFACNEFFIRNRKRTKSSQPDKRLDTSANKGSDDVPDRESGSGPDKDPDTIPDKDPGTIPDPYKGFASDFARKIEQQQSAYPQPIPEVMQNLLGSHDTDRIASRIVNSKLKSGRSWWEYFNRSKAEHGEYDTRKPTPEEERVKRLMVLVQFTVPGSPMIYYGDEAGMWGANDPCCRKPMVWPDYEYEPESVLPDGTPRSRPGRVAFDNELHDYYRRLIHLRKQHPPLRNGGFETVLTDDDRGILVYRRSYEDQEMFVAVNNSNKRVSVDLPGECSGPLRRLMSSQPDGKQVARIEKQNGKKNRIHLELPPEYGVILG